MHETANKARPSCPEPAHTSASGGAISNTGPHLFTLIGSRSNQNTEVTNTNKVTITNTNTQTAISGSATVSGNTSSGSATNINHAEFDVAITNN